MIGISNSLDLRGEAGAACSRLRDAAAIVRAYGRGEDGASAAEYAILLFVLCGCVFFGLHSLGRHTSHEIQNVARAINPRPRS